MKKIIFKLFEFSSNIFSKSHQLKDISIVSLTEGFDLNINIFESLLKTYKINYSGNSSILKICLRKKKLTLGIGQMNIIKKKQTVKIYPTINNPDKKIITLIVLCYDKKEFTEKNFESSRNQDRVLYNLNNNSNANNSSSFSKLSLFLKKNKTPANKKQKIIFNQKNKSQAKLNNGSKQKKLFTRLTHDSIHSNNSNIFQYDKDKENISIFSDNQNGKSILSGSISQYCKNCFSERKESNKKIFSPAIYSYPYDSSKIIDGKNKKNEKKKRNFNNKSMINPLIIPKLDLKLDGELKNFKISPNLNLDKMKEQIDEYIIDKSFEDVLQNDVPIITQEDKQFFYYEDLNSNRCKKLIKDLLLLYNDDNKKNVNDNEIKYEADFLISKIYELMEEYYKEYFFFENQNKSLINSIKNFGNRYNNLEKQRTKLKIIIYKNKIKKDLSSKTKNNLQFFNSKINEFNNELEILKNINQININNDYSNVNSNKKNELREILSNIISKNKSKILEQEKSKLKKLGITINEDKSKVLFTNSSNKKLNIKNGKKKKSNKRINSSNSISKKSMNTHLNIKDINKITILDHNKIRVKTQISKKIKNNINTINKNNDNDLIK